MKNNILSFIILIAFFFTACDENLFKTKDEVDPPQVGEVQTLLSDNSLYAGDTTKFWIIPTNPDTGPFSFQWSATKGEFISTTDEDTCIWRAPFKGGDLTISVKVSNSEKSVTKTKQIIIKSLANPVVSILSPGQGIYLVQFESTEIKAEAFHDNGIFSVEFFVNDNLINTIGGNESNVYMINWSNTAPAGLTKIKVRAKAQITGTTSMDSVSVITEGVVPGKK